MRHCGLRAGGRPAMLRYRIGNDRGTDRGNDRDTDRDNEIEETLP